MKKQFKTIIDISAINLDTIIFSAGKIGFQIEINIDKLSKILEFTIESIT